MRPVRYGAGLAVLNLSLALGATAVAAEPQRLVALGDSLTQGYGLPEGDGFVPQLARWLADQGREVVINNAGVSGDTTAGGLSRLDWTLAEPADAMIVTLGGNDVLRGLDPAVSQANLDAILTKAGERGIPVLLVGMEAPGNYGPDYQQRFAAIYPELAAEHGVLLADSFLAPLRDGSGDDAAAMRAWMQADGIHPNKEGVARIVAALGPRVVELLDQAAAQ